MPWFGHVARVGPQQRREEWHKREWKHNLTLFFFPSDSCETAPRDTALSPDLYEEVNKSVYSGNWKILHC